MASKSLQLLESDMASSDILSRFKAVPLLEASGQATKEKREAAATLFKVALDKPCLNDNDRLAVGSCLVSACVYLWEEVTAEEASTTSEPFLLTTGSETKECLKMLVKHALENDVNPEKYFGYAPRPLNGITCGILSGLHPEAEEQPYDCRPKLKGPVFEAFITFLEGFLVAECGLKEQWHDSSLPECLLSIDRPLGDACACGELELVKYLLSKGADPCLYNEVHPLTPLSLVFKGAHVDVAAYLISTGINLEGCFVATAPLDGFGDEGQVEPLIHVWIDMLFIDAKKDPPCPEGSLSEVRRAFFRRATLITPGFRASRFI
jgi:hypothetical protein